MCVEVVDCVVYFVEDFDFFDVCDCVGEVGCDVCEFFVECCWVGWLVVCV